VQQTGSDHKEVRERALRELHLTENSREKQSSSVCHNHIHISTAHSSHSKREMCENELRRVRNESNKIPVQSRMSVMNWIQVLISLAPHLLMIIAVSVVVVAVASVFLDEDHIVVAILLSLFAAVAASILILACWHY